QPAFDRGHQAELLRRHDHPLALLPVPRHVLLDRVRVVELAVALQRIPHVIETGPVLLEERPEHAGARMKDPGPDELAGLDLIGVREDVGRRGLRIARGGDAPRQIREILPYRRLVNAPRGPRMGMDVDQAGDDGLPRHVDDARAGGRRTGGRHARDPAVRHDDVALTDQLVTLHGDDPGAPQHHRAAGNGAAEVSDTLIAGGAAPTSGSVTRYT